MECSRLSRTVPTDLDHRRVHHEALHIVRSAMADMVRRVGIGAMGVMAIEEDQVVVVVVGTVNTVNISQGLEGMQGVKEVVAIGITNEDDQKIRDGTDRIIATDPLGTNIQMEAEDGLPIKGKAVRSPTTANRIIVVLDPTVNGAGTMAVPWGVNGVKRAIKTTATRIQLNFALNFDRIGAVNGTMSAGFATLSSPTLRALSIRQSPPNQMVKSTMIAMPWTMRTRKSHRCRRRVNALSRTPWRTR